MKFRISGQYNLRWPFNTFMSMVGTTADELIGVLLDNEVYGITVHYHE